MSLGSFRITNFISRGRWLECLQVVSLFGMDLAAFPRIFALQKWRNVFWTCPQKIRVEKFFPTLSRGSVCCSSSRGAARRGRRRRCWRRRQSGTRADAPLARPPYPQSLASSGLLIVGVIRCNEWWKKYYIWSHYLCLGNPNFHILHNQWIGWLIMIKFL